MKRYIAYGFAVLSSCILYSCMEKEGTMPGTDSAPVVTVYTYAPGEEYNADNDVMVRCAVNNAVSELYYYAAPKTEMDSYVAENGEDAYIDYVIGKGVKITDVPEKDYADVIITDLAGDYAITAVVTGKGTRNMATVYFTGLMWTDIAVGTYEFGAPITSYLGLEPVSVTFQRCENKKGLYRFKDIYGAGTVLQITALDKTGTDDDGDEYTYCRIPFQSMPYEFGSYGTVYIQDCGYWQGDEAYVTQYGYETRLYSDYSVAVLPVYLVSAGYLSYLYYDYFIPSSAE